MDSKQNTTQILGDISIADIDQLTKQVYISKLPDDWRSLSAYPILQQIGNCVDDTVFIWPYWNFILQKHDTTFSVYNLVTSIDNKFLSVVGSLATCLSIF